MRGVYTAGLVATLIESGLDFPHVSGISAGSSHTVNYVSRDAARAHDSFVDVALSPEFGGYKHWLAGRGIFNVDYLYHDIAEADGDFPFDYDTFVANPAQIRVGSFNATRGQAVWFTKEDMHSVSDVGLLARASSTLPVLMPPVEIDGDTYVDGALGPNGGIPLDAPMRDGYRKFLIVLTRPRNFIKPATRLGTHASMRAAFPRLPSIADAVTARSARYNAARKTAFRLEAEGRAYVYCPEVTEISKLEMRYEVLEEAYKVGYAQAQRELPAIKEFLGV